MTGGTTTGAEVRRALRDGEEVALVDVRPEGRFAEGHPLFAANFPIDRLEPGLLDRLPRPASPLVVYGEDETDTAEACGRLRSYGYLDVSALEGGLAAWSDGGGELFIDVNAPSKAFGELVAERLGTPSVAPEELSRMLGDGVNVTVLDARRFDEYQTMSIPSATSVPSAGLVRHVSGLPADDDRLLVVNCAGRTRSIIGTQSLINAGAPRVVALRNGTIGWTLAGLDLDHGAGRRGGPVAPDARRRAAAAARAVADRAGVRRIDRAGLDDLLRQDRTVYRFDVRDPEEHRAGHPSGFLSAPGGQLVQETDRYAPVRGAVIVLADDDGSEASMTGSWLAQMGWTVVVLDGVRAGDGGETGPDPARSPVPPDIVWCEPDDLADDALHAARTVLDVDTSVRYRAGHVPGAIWVRRHDPALRAGRLTVSGPGPVVVTSHDDLLTAFAARDLAVRLGVDVVGLRGGTARWATTHPLETGDGRWGSDPVDVYRRPYEGTDVQPSAMQAYLDWEYGLVEQLGRDATHNFTVLDFSVLDFSVRDVGVRQSPPVPPATVP